MVDETNEILNNTGFNIGEDPIDPKALTPKIPDIPEMSPELAKFMQQNSPPVTPPTVNTGQVIGSPSTESIRQMLNNAQINGVPVATDPFKTGKQIMGDFRNPNLQHQFYERYAEHPDFDELGFTPFRNNEELYNQNSSWLDEIRVASGQWATLAGLGFKDALGFGDLTDPDTATDYERAMAIGSSSKGGFTGFITNLYLNSGYSVGILGELAVEEIGLLLGEIGLTAATGATWGAASPALAANTTLMGARATRAFGKIKTAWNTAKNLGKTLDNLKDVNKAREYFTKVLKGTGNFINPLENTVDFFRGADQMKDINNLLKTAKGFGAFYRDVRNVRLAFGEGSLEGGMVQNKLERDLMEDFKTEHGRMPNRAEIAEIRQTAAQAGATTSLINAPVIFFSNKLTFDGLVRGRFKNMGSDVIQSGLGRNIIFNPKKGMKEAYKAVPSNYFKARWEYIKTPKLWLSGAAKYGKANIAEGLQEVAQETIAGASEDYYTAKFKGDPTRGGYMSYIASNIEKQISPQGFETFMSGFLMGGFVAPVSRISGATIQSKQTLSNMRMKFSDPQRYAEIKQAREQQLSDDVKTLNEFYADPEKYLSPDLMNMIEQKEFGKVMEMAKQNNDMKTFYDVKDSSELKHVTTALKYGRLGTYIERLTDLKNLSAEEVKESFGADHQEFTKAMEVAIDRAKKIESRWKMAQDKFKNPFNPGRHKYNSLAYQEEAVKKIAWDNAIEELVFNQYSFDRALERQQSILSLAKDEAGLKNTPYSEFNTLFTIKDAQGELNTLKKELDALSGELIDPQSRQFKKEKEQRYEKLKAFTDAMQEAMIEVGPNESITPKNYSNVKKAYLDYIKFISTKNRDFANSDAIDKSLDKILDYHLLSNRSLAANNAVNALLDPQGFINLYNRTSDLQTQLHNNREAEIRSSLEEFLKLKDQNEMLNELFEAGMFFDPQDLIALQNEGKVPGTFYYIEAGKGEVPKTSGDYQKALTILKNYVSTLEDINIPQAVSDPYYSFARRKDENDKRTYIDYADQFGFDPDADSSSISLNRVLQAIVNSEHASEREVALAEKLMELASSDDIVTFRRNLTTPGLYTPEQQTVIDARYSAHEYKQGRNGHPIEHAILHEEVHRRTVESLQSNKEFRENMRTLYDHTVQVWENLPDTAKADLVSDISEPFYGLKNIEEFVAEAMSNDTFQQFLGRVEINTLTEKTSGWKKFVDLVIENFEKIFSRKPNGTVLNAAMDVIATNIDQTFADTIDTTAAQTTGTGAGPVTRSISIGNLRGQHPELAKTIMDLFRAENENRRQDGADQLLKGIESMSDEEVFRSPQFGSYLSSPMWRKKESVITDYNKHTGAKTETPTRKRTHVVSDKEYQDFVDTGKVSKARIAALAQKIKSRGTAQEQQFTRREAEMYNVSEIAQDVEKLLKAETKQAPKIISEDMKKKLKDLGYSRADVKNMNPGRAQRFINEGVTKQEREISEAPKVDSALVEKAKKLREGIHNVIHNVENMEDYRAAEAQVLAMFSENPEYRTVAKIQSEELNSLFQAKLEELAFSINFEDIRIGEVIMLNDKQNSKILVLEKTKNELTLEHLRGDRKIFNMSKEEVPQKIKFRYSEALEQVEISDLPEVSAEDREKASESLNNLTEINTAEAIQKDIEDAKNKSTEELTNDLLDSICK